MFSKKDKKESRQDARTLLQKVTASFEERQHQIAGYLSNKTERLSIRAKKVCLILFGLLIGGLSLWLILTPFRQNEIIQSVKYERIRFPGIAPIQDTEAFITEEEYAKILKFKNTIDSLKQTKEGKAIYDDLIKNRKGLVDSINFILSTYK